MKLSKIFMSVLFLTCVVSLSSLSFADAGMRDAKVKLFKDSAAALSTSNPDLSAGLTKWADEEANEPKDQKMEKMDSGEKDAHIKLLKDSAAALQASHADLAKGLTKHAEHMEKKMNGMEKK